MALSYLRDSLGPRIPDDIACFRKILAAPERRRHSTNSAAPKCETPSETIVTGRELEVVSLEVTA